MHTEYEEATTENAQERREIDEKEINKSFFFFFPFFFSTPTILTMINITQHRQKVTIDEPRRATAKRQQRDLLPSIWFGWYIVGCYATLRCIATTQLVIYIFSWRKRPSVKGRMKFKMLLTPAHNKKIIRKDEESHLRKGNQ